MARTINRLSEWIISALITKQVFYSLALLPYMAARKKRSSVAIWKILKNSLPFIEISRIFQHKNTIDEGESSHLVSNCAHTLFCSECKSDFEQVSF